MRLYLLVCVLCGCFLRRVFLRLLLSGAGAGPPFCSGGDGRAARRVLGVVIMAAFLVVSSSRVRIDNLFIKF
jgi:hypothetical protein